MSEPPREGVIAAASLEALSIALAGALAESGVKQITLTDAAGERRELYARLTDLPGEIARALAPGPKNTGKSALLTAAAPSLRIEISDRGHARWLTTDPALADALSSLAVRTPRDP